jgi:carbamoyl-phosphate synthase small subunit
MQVQLHLEDGSSYPAQSFGAAHSVAGEVVFSTGMVGYPESLTDPSYTGQILVCTYPMIGNYGVPPQEYWESDQIHVRGLVIASYSDDTTHHQSIESLGTWLNREGIPGVAVLDTRSIAQKIRKQGTMLGQIVIDSDVEWYDPNNINLVAQVSTQKLYKVPASGKRLCHIILVDCGAKRNIIRSLTERGADVTVVPWNYDILGHTEPFDGVLLSNGPGDPMQVSETVKQVQLLLKKNIPILGICLGNQMLALAAGGSTHKLKFGHRGQNQPVRLLEGDEDRLYLTTQNHSFAVKKIPEEFDTWFVNANDGSNEGIRHKKKPWMSVQFHPESCPGPTDTKWVFDEFLKYVV